MNKHIWQTEAFEIYGQFWDMSGLFQDILDSLLETDPNAGKMYTATILGSTSPRGIFGTRMWEP